MKMVTWNVNSINVRLPQLLEWLTTAQPDVVGLQELKCRTEEFPLEALKAVGYHALVNGQKTYNGVALLAKTALLDPVLDLPNYADEQKRVVAATIEGIRVINAYVPNGQEPGSDKYRYKLEWFEHFHTYVAGQLVQYPALVILGDFNIAPTDDDVHDPRAWKDKILCTDQERAAFNALLGLGLVDGLRVFSQLENTFTWWDYRQQGFEHNEGVRIDHLLLSKTISAQLINTQVYTAIRANERPSDHAPVAIELKE